MRHVAALLSAVILLSGCIGVPQDQAPPPIATGPASPGEGPAPEAEGTIAESPAGNATGTATKPWNVTMEGCTLLVASIAIPADEAQPYMPEGFEADSFGGAPGTAGAALIAVRCSRAYGPASEFRDHHESYVYIYATPPERYRTENISNYRVLVRHGVGSGALIDAYASHDHSAEKVATVAQVAMAGESAESMTASAGFKDVAFSFGGPAGFLPPGGGLTLRLFAVEKGQVSGAIDFELMPFSVSVGASRYTVDSGSLFGTQGGPAQILQYDTGAGAAYVVTPVALPT